MRAVHLLLAGLLLAGLVAGLWFFLDAPAPNVRAAHASGSSNAAASSRANLAAESTSSSASSAEDAARRALESPQAPVDATNADAAPRKPRVHGRVVTQSGAPIAGASVLFAKGAQWFAPLPLDLESDGMPRNGLDVKRAQTDAEGNYAFEDVTAGNVRLAARASSFAPRYEDRWTIKAKGDEALPDLVLAPGVVVAGRVVDRAGEAVKGAQILQSAESLSLGRGVSVPGRGIPLTRTDENGAFRVDQLACGPWCLLVEAEGFLTHEERGKTSRAGEATEGLRIVLAPGQEIRGRVRGEGRPPIVRISARATRAEGEPAPEEPDQPSERDVNLLRARHALVDGEGNFVISGLKPMASYRLSASVPATDGATDPPRWKRVSAIEGATAIAGQRGVEIEWKPESVITFQVVDKATRAPLSELTVWAGVGRERVLRDDKGETQKSFPEGRVRCSELRPQAGKTVQIRVRAAGYKDHERKDVALAAGAALDLGVVELERERALDVRVVEDATGAPVRGAIVALTLGDEDQMRGMLGDDTERDVLGDSRSWSARTDESGRARLSSAPGKSVVVGAMAKEHLASEPLRALLPEDADHALELRLKRGGSVLVRVSDSQGRPVKGVGIAHKRPGDESEEDGGWVALQSEKSTDAEGLARFDTQRPGVHRFLVHDEAGEMWINPEDPSAARPVWTERTVVEGAAVEIAFVAAPRGGLVGRVREAGRPIEGARLRLSRIRDGEPQADSWGGPNDPFSTSTDHEGAYRYEDLRCGDYWLSIHHASRRMGARHRVRITEQVSTFDIDLDMASIEGVVMDTDGRPVAGVEVGVSAVTDEGGDEGPYEMVVREDERGNPQTQWRSPSRASERTDAAGHYTLRGLRSNVALVVAVHSEMLEPGSTGEITLQPDEARTGVDFRLRRAGVIAVALTGAVQGKNQWYEVRVSRVAAAASNPGENGGEGADATPQEEVVQSSWIGSWNRNVTLAGLAPGRYRVSLHRPEHRGASDAPGAPSAQEVEVRAQETTSVSFPAY